MDLRFFKRLIVLIYTICNYIFGCQSAMCKVQKDHLQTLKNCNGLILRRACQHLLVSLPVQVGWRLASKVRCGITVVLDYFLLHVPLACKKKFPCLLGLVILLLFAAWENMCVPCFSCIATCACNKYQQQLIMNIVPAALLHKRIRWRLLSTYRGRFGA